MPTLEQLWESNREFIEGLLARLGAAGR